MKRGLLICAGLVALCSFGEIEVGGLPGWELADTEVSTNVPFALPRENVKHLVFTLALAGTPSLAFDDARWYNMECDKEEVRK